MRQFFKDCLYNLYAYCGNRQAEKMTDDEIKFLLDALERISKLYHYIPEERQKEIITNCLLTDKEYQNINVRTVAKWLELNGKQYFQEVAHIPSEAIAEVVSGEKRQEWLEIWSKSLADMNEAFTSATKTGGSGTRLRENIERSTGNQKFVFDGFEIWAKTEEEARNIYETQVGKR